MFAIEYLEQEHSYILKLTNRIEEESLKILNGENVDIDFFKNSVLYIKKFADAEHHKKEEDIFFKYMVENLGAVAEKLIKNGMLVEHDMARFYILSLSEAISSYEENGDDKSKLYIITNAMNYAELLRRHIDKENNVVYTFGERELSEEVKNKIEEEMKNRVKEEKINEDEKNSLLEKLNIVM